MVFKEVYFAEIELKLKLKIEIIESQIKVEILKDKNIKGLFFCCYLLAYNNIIFRGKYTKDNVFNYTLNKMADLDLKVYVKTIEDDLRLSKTVNIGFVYVKSIYTKNLMNRLSNHLNSNLGQDFYENKIIKFSPFDTVKTNFNEIYKINPFSNRTWRWKAHQLAYVPYLISYYLNLKEKNENILSYLIDGIKKWQMYSLTENADNDSMLWHDHATALRLENLILSLNIFLENKFISYKDKSYIFILNLINQHMVRLKDEDFYSKHTNHGFDQSIFLYYASIELEYLISNSKELNEIAKKRILNEINFAFCKDGGHKENSPAYLNFGIKQCLSFRELQKNYLEPECSEVLDIVDKATMVLTYAVKPNGYLPLIGDTSEFKISNIFQDYKPKFFKKFMYAITGGVEGEKPNESYILLKESGYFFYKSNWSNLKECIYLSFKAGYLSNYHRHDDDLSITLFGYNEDWLVDGGIYKYDEKDVSRRYIRSSDSHNLFSPLGFLAQRKLAHKVSLQLINSNDNEIKVAGYSEMFKDFSNYREILIKGEEITFQDTCKSHTYINFDIVSRFFFPEDKEISIHNNKIIVCGKQKKMILEVSSDIDFNIVFNGNNKVPKAWLSKKNGTLYQANLVEVFFKSENLGIVDYNIAINFMDI